MFGNLFKSTQRTIIKDQFNGNNFYATDTNRLASIQEYFHSDAVAVAKRRTIDAMDARAEQAVEKILELIPETRPARERLLAVARLMGGNNNWSQWTYMQDIAKWPLKDSVAVAWNTIGDILVSKLSVVAGLALVALAALYGSAGRQSPEA